MKVTVEGTTEELLDLAKLLVYARADTTRPDTQASDDVHNRFREEGV